MVTEFVSLLHGFLISQFVKQVELSPKTSVLIGFLDFDDVGVKHDPLKFYHSIDISFPLDNSVLLPEFFL